MLRHTVIETSLGPLTLVAEDHDLVGVYYDDHWTKPDVNTFGQLVQCESDPLLAEAAAQLRSYLTNERRHFDLPYRTAGNQFQEAVWQKLIRIPYGKTVTYGEIAEELGNIHLARQVGQAVGANPLSIIIPCHRVMGKHAKITGYAGGVQRKQHLLQLEEALYPADGRLF